MRSLDDVLCALKNPESKMAVHYFFTVFLSIIALSTCQQNCLSGYCVCDKLLTDIRCSERVPSLPSALEGRVEKMDFSRSKITFSQLIKITETFYSKFSIHM